MPRYRLWWVTIERVPKLNWVTKQFNYIRMKKRILTAAAFALLFGFQMNATSLTVVPLSGEEQSTAIDEIASWQFQGDTVMVLYSKADHSVLYTKKLAEVRKVVFKETSTANEETKNNNSAYAVYPNPTQDELFVKGADEQTELRVIDLQGRVVRSVKGSSVNVDNLSNGVYNLLVNGQVLRFIKK